MDDLRRRPGAPRVIRPEQQHLRSLQHLRVRIEQLAGLHFETRRGHHQPVAGRFADVGTPVGPSISRGSATVDAALVHPGRGSVGGAKDFDMVVRGTQLRAHVLAGDHAPVRQRGDGWHVRPAPRLTGKDSAVNDLDHQTASTLKNTLQITSWRRGQSSLRFASPGCYRHVISTARKSV